MLCALAPLATPLPALGRATRTSSGCRSRSPPCRASLPTCSALSEDNAGEIRRLNESLAEQNAPRCGGWSRTGACRRRRSPPPSGHHRPRVRHERAAADGAREQRCRLPPLPRRPAPRSLRDGRRRRRSPRGHDAGPDRRRLAGARPARALQPGLRRLRARQLRPRRSRSYSGVPAQLSRHRPHATTRSTGSASASTRSRSTREAIEAWDEPAAPVPVERQAARTRALKKGMALERLGRRSQALLEYRVVADRFPTPRPARKAREKTQPR